MVDNIKNSVITKIADIDNNSTILNSKMGEIICGWEKLSTMLYLAMLLVSIVIRLLNCFNFLVLDISNRLLQNNIKKNFYNR